MNDKRCTNALPCKTVQNVPQPIIIHNIRAHIDIYNVIYKNIYNNIVVLFDNEQVRVIPKSLCDCRIFLSFLSFCPLRDIHKWQLNKINGTNLSWLCFEIHERLQELLINLHNNAIINWIISIMRSNQLITINYDSCVRKWIQNEIVLCKRDKNKWMKRDCQSE